MIYNIVSQTSQEVIMEVNIYEAKANLSRLIQFLIDEKEDEVIICKNGTPVVQMSRIQPKKKTRRIGIAKGKLPDLDLDVFNSVDVEELFYGKDDSL